MTFKPNLLASAIILSSSAFSYAQAPKQHAPVYEEIIVTGQADLLQKALERQRNADNIISAINANGIGRLPDNNLAEALQRVSGISIERDQGEGRFVRIRGMSPEFNAVSVNGVQIPAPEAGSRAVALDVIPSTILSSVIVSKTLTPDMDANSIGGNIEVESLSALDRESAFYNVRAQASYDDLTDQTSPSFALSGGTVLNREGQNRLGVVGALSWDDRKFGSDNVETGGKWGFDTSEALLEEFEQRQYSVDRERLGAALNFDLNVSDNHLLYWRTLYSEFTDVEQRLANVIEFDGDGRKEGELGLAEVQRELKDREETQIIASTSIGGEHAASQWMVKYNIGYSEASEEEPGGIGGAVFKSDSMGNMGFYDTREPRASVIQNFFNPAMFTLDEVEYTEAKTEDKQKSIKLDAERKFELNDASIFVKFGFKTSQREKSQDATEYLFEDFDDLGFSDANLSLTEFSYGEADYSLGAFGPIIDPNKVYTLLNTLDANEFLDEEESRIGDHTIDEDINAAYFLTRLDTYNWLILMGMRFEQTDLAFSGVAFDGDETFDTINDTNDYQHFLPNVQVRYSLNDDTQLRAAWTNSVVRPSFEQLAPSFIDDGEEAEFGNTQLEPLESSNIDLGIEHFSGVAGTLSAFVFYKDIENFVYSTDLAGTPTWQGYDEVITYENGDAASLSGLELAYSRKLDNLPSPFNNFLVSINATFSESEATISTSDDGNIIYRNIPMPNQSDTTGNLILGYETDQYMLRLALNYKSKYLLEVNDITDATGDIYQSAQSQVDFSSHYTLNNNVTIGFEVANLLNEPYYTYINSSAYNAQYEEYGVSYRLSVSYSSL